MSPSEAFSALNLLLGWESPWIPVYGHADARTADLWHQASQRNASAVLHALCDRREGACVGPGQRTTQDGGPTSLTILWARVQGSEQEKRAHRFRPLPTLVLREGSSTRRLLIWALTAPLRYEDCYAANRRIAYRLGAKQKDGRPEFLRIPAPGQPAGRGTVDVTRLEGVAYVPGDVVGRLKDPPEPKWERRAA